MDIRFFPKGWPRKSGYTSELGLSHHTIKLPPGTRGVKPQKKKIRATGDFEKRVLARRIAQRYWPRPKVVPQVCSDTGFGAARRMA